MNVKEFNNYNRGIAYHIESYYRGEITKEKLYETMQAHIGEDAFEAAKKIKDKDKAQQQ
jgi:hypothetical protein